MRIALVVSRIFNGGVTTHMADLALELKKRGHSVDIYVGKTDDVNSYFYNILYDLQSKGILIYNFTTTAPSQSKLKSVFNYFWLIIFFSRRLKNKYDIVHAHSMSLGLGLKIAGVRFVKTIHISNHGVGILNAKGNQEIAVSDEIYAERIGYFQNDKSRLNLIYNGVSKKYYSLYDESYNSKRLFYNSKIQILVVASVDYRKGHDILLKALDHLSTENLDKLEVNFLGQYDQEAQEWLKPFITDRIKGKVAFHGVVNPEPFYSFSNITILPSRREGFGLTTVEGMLAGNLAIRSNVEGAKQQIHPETGYLFESEDHLGLSKILSFLVHNPDVIFDKALKGREYAYKHFTLDKMVDRVEEVYKKIII